MALYMSNHKGLSAGVWRCYVRRILALMEQDIQPQERYLNGALYQRQPGSLTGYHLVRARSSGCSS